MVRAMPELHVLPTPEEAAQAAASFVANLADKSVSTEGRFTIALSGGTTPRHLYEILASSPHAERTAWDGWHIFWGDERCVPTGHNDSNFRMAREALLERVSIPPSQIHRMRGEIDPEKAADEYEIVLRDVFKTPTPSFDLILLGIGEDGHTASLFPGTQVLKEQSRLVVAYWVRHLEAHRITFTLPLINAAKTVAFLVTERSKGGVVKQALDPKPQTPEIPAAMVRPTSGAVHWFLTGGAAIQLRDEA